MGESVSAVHAKERREGGREGGKEGKDGKEGEGMYTCKGVPVISSRWAVRSIRTVWENCDASFLSLWASSMIRYCQANLLRGFFSRLQIS